MACQCEICGKTFSRQDILKRHAESVHSKDVRLQCNICLKDFSRRDSLLRHTKQHTKGDEHGQKPTSSGFSPLQPDRNSVHQTQSTSVTGLHIKESNQEPTDNKRKVETVDQVGEHSSKRIKVSDNSADISQEDPVELPANVNELCSTLHPPERNDCSSEDFVRLYKKHWNIIRTKFRRQNKLRDVYNFRLNQASPDVLIRQTELIFSDQRSVFKLNIGLGFFLRNVETCELRYYYASNNSKLFSEPFLITNISTLGHLTEVYLAQDLLEHARLQRPNSKWVVETITNVTYFVYKIPDHPIGCNTIDLPDFVKNNKSIVTLQRNRQTGKCYQDNLCLFRCLTLFRGSSPKSLEKEAEKMCRFYSQGMAPKIFAGVRMKELNRFEEIFKVNVVVYELTKQDNDGDGVVEIKLKKITKNGNAFKLRTRRMAARSSTT
ncbi:Zinc finger protein MSN2 [Holothuria leucospilota]|uniref:Zinc finger protein MSN2 n=1 Tax=Holothuria leucospilota TaxID=206669 RepID=A0A9Q0YK29_HOLLE|nr:Zinc finger protein MSN2 [Holothuria leucospilota]